MLTFQMNCFPLQQNTKQSMYNQNTKFCFCATVLWNKPILFHLPHHGVQPGRKEISQKSIYWFPYDGHAGFKGLNSVLLFVNFMKYIDFLSTKIPKTFVCYVDLH